MALTRALAVSLLVLAAPALVNAQPGAPAAAKSDAPISTAPGASSEQQASDWPQGAPHGDYEFTGWCYGVLKRHMELYSDVKPELTKISKRWKTEEEDEASYAEQQESGKKALELFAHALQQAEKASVRPINTQGAAAVEQGRKMWNQLSSVEPTWQAYSWMNWELPERCVTVATALDNKSRLLGQVLVANTSNRPSAAAVRATPVEAAKVAALPAPTPIETPKALALRPTSIDELVKDAEKPAAKDATVKTDDKKSDGKKPKKEKAPSTVTSDPETWTKLKYRP